MPQDFSQQNLRGRSFKGQDLAGANFSGADIRGADFTNAKLIGADFRGAKAGLQRRWVVGLIVCSWLLAVLSGLFSAIIIALTAYVLEPANTLNFIMGIVSLITLAIFFIVVFRKGLVAGAVAVASAVTIALAVAIAVVAGALVVAGAVAGAVAVALALAVAGAVAGAVAVALALAVAVAIAVAAGAVAVALALASAYIGWLGWAGDEKYALVRSFAVAFAAIGGTSFHAADLTDANFARARLKSTDFREAILTRTCWYKTRMLDHIRPGKTYLQNTQVRQVLVTGYGQGKNFDRQDLRWVNFTGATLTNASFIGANLSGANLQDADLSEAKLVRTQLDETDLTGATLTGVCIEDWGITSHTKLDKVRCKYVFMRNTPDVIGENHRRRKPDNCDEEFEDDGFADFIQPLIDTLDLYHTQGVTPRAIAISFQDLAQNHPDAELEIVAMERRGKNFLLRVKTAPGVNLSNLSAEYFSTYNQIKSLVEQEVQKLSTQIDHRIISVENAVQTALQRPNYYSINRIQRIDTVHNNPGGFSIGGSIGGNVNNVSERNQTVQGSDNQAVLGDNNQVKQRNQTSADPETLLSQADVVKLLTELETLIRGVELPENTKEEAIEDLSAAKKATDKEEPKKNVALANLESMVTTLEKASKTIDAGQTLWAKAKPIVVKVAGWLGAAAGSHLLGL